MKKVIVTGGAGFIGSHLVDKLISKGVTVIVLDNLSSGKEKNINPKATHINVDLSTMDTKKFHRELYPMKFWNLISVAYITTIIFINLFFVAASSILLKYFKKN